MKDFNSWEWTLSAVNQIPQGSVTPIIRENLLSLIEEPLLEACQILYDKNIKTLMSSANGANNTECYIDLDYDSLSKENKKIALKNWEIQSLHWSIESKIIKISMITNSETDIEEIKHWAKQLALKFKKQPMLWAKKFTIQELKDIYWIDNLNNEHLIKTFQDSFFYDPKTGYFYASEEHFRKEQEFLAKK